MTRLDVNITKKRVRMLKEDTIACHHSNIVRSWKNLIHTGTQNSTEFLSQRTSARYGNYNLLLIEMQSITTPFWRAFYTSLSIAVIVIVIVLLFFPVQDNCWNRNVNCKTLNNT